MTHKTQNHSGTVAVAGVAGAVVGAGAAVAATKLMSDKKMRDRVKGTFTQVRDQVMEAIDTKAKDGLEGTKKAVSERLKNLDRTKKPGNSARGRDVHSLS